MKYSFWPVLFLLLPFMAEAQDPIFTQFYNIPEALNPAFTGSANVWNAGIAHRRQWPSENRRIDTEYAFLDNLVTDELGVGGSVQEHREVFTGYHYFQVNAAASYRIELSYDWRVRFGIEAGYGQKDFGYDSLLLEDQINVSTGAISGPSADPSLLQKNKIGFFDMTAGILADSEDAWVGVSLRHLTRPDISFTENGNVPLNMFLSVHGAYFLDVEGLPTFFFPEGTSVMLMGNYMRQSQYNRFDAGTVVDYGMFAIGAFAAVNLQRSTGNGHFLTSVNPVATFNFGEFKFGYSLDVNTSGIGRTGGVHELTLVWQSSRQCSRCDNYKVRLKRNGVAGYVKG